MLKCSMQVDTLQHFSHSNKHPFQVVSIPDCCEYTTLSLGFAVSQQPRVRDEDVTQLQEMFPTLGTDVLRSVLEANNGVVDSAVTALLQMTET